MAKLMCKSCGGKVKMAVGGTASKKVLAEAPVNMYGIPQENMGTSSQYGFGRKGGAVKKHKVGGMAAYEKSSYDKKMDAKGSNGKEDSAKDKAADKKAAIKMGYIKKEGGTHKMPNGKVMLNSKMKMGGTTKATKFAALAPPYNKATFADRIVGAKMTKKRMSGVTKKK